ncbi:hypothetical protein LLG95_06285 [bacterium]|nr:hypothetical protein [bacterium]
MKRLGARGLIFGLMVFAGFIKSAAAMTERELMDYYLGTVESAVDIFEPLWVEGDVPGAGHFDFQSYQNWTNQGYVALITTPGNGELIFCYATLLTQTDKQFFGKNKVPRAVIRDHAMKAIRWIVMTSGHVPGHVRFPIPGLSPAYIKDGGYARKIDQPHDSMGWFTVGAAMLWAEIDPALKDKMEYMFKGNAQQERQPGGWRLGQAGYQDRVKKNMSITMGAAWLLKDPKEMARYREIITGNILSLPGTKHDFAAKTIAAGKPIKDWAMDWNLYEDYSSDHHRWAQIWYGSDAMFEGRSFIEFMSRFMGTPVPQTATWPGNGFKGVLGWDKAIVTPEGEPASVHGMEYDSYYGSGLLAFAFGATVGKDPVAAALEEQAAIMHRRNALAIGQYDYHRNAWAKAAAAYLWHKFEGPRAEPLPLPEAMAAMRGTWHYKWQNALVQRTDDKFVSFSWGAMLQRKGEEDYHYPRGWVFPARGWQTGVEPLVYMHPQSLFGRMTAKVGGTTATLGQADVLYNEWRDDQSFSSTGEAADKYLARRGAFHAFERGPAVWLLSVEALQPVRIDWTGMPLHFYARDGVTTPRTYTDAQGSVPLEQPTNRKSAWWSVGDRLGITTLGLGDNITIRRIPGQNWARKPGYRDCVDVVAIGGMEARPYGTGQSIDSAVVIYPDAKAEQIAAAQAALQKEGKMKLPAGWAGVVAPDAIRPGIRHLALSRLNGKAEFANLNLSFDEGAPVLGVPTDVNGNKAHVNAVLAPMRSLTESFDLYLNADGDVTARRVGLGKWRIEPNEKGSVKLKLNWPDSLEGVTGRWIQDGRRPVALDLGKGKVSLKIAGPGVIELTGGRYEDKVAPAVEIVGLENREDGRMKITAQAADRSRIASVELWCDGEPVATRNGAPWEFVHFPGEGLHTWQAIATDGAGNKRESFKRTVEVKIERPPMQIPNF